MIKLKTALLVPAFASIALSATATVALADTEPVASTDSVSTSAVRQTPATVTVTAIVAPGQCRPIEGGPQPVAVTDTAGAPAPSPAPEAADAPVTVTTVAHEAAAPANGASTSRFDPYTCVPVAASDATSASPSPDSLGAEATGAALPSYTAPLAPFPGSEGGSGTAGGHESVTTSTQKPLSEPTTSSTLPAAPAPR